MLGPSARVGSGQAAGARADVARLPRAVPGARRLRVGGLGAPRAPAATQRRPAGRRADRPLPVRLPRSAACWRTSGR